MKEFIDLIISTGYGPWKAILGGVYAAIVFIIFKAYAHFVRVHRKKLDITRDKMDFISTYFSEGSDHDSRLYKELVYNYIYDSVASLSSRIIDYFQTYDNSNLMLKEYSVASFCFEYKSHHEHPQLKKEYAEKGRLKKEQKKAWINLIVSCIGIVSPVFILMFSLSDDELVSGLFVCISISVAAMIMLYISAYDMRRYDSAGRIVRAINEHKESIKTLKSEHRASIWSNIL